MTASLVLNDGSRTLDLVGTPPQGVYIRDTWTPPLPERENTYSESADSERSLRVRSRPKNAEGSIPLAVGAKVEADFWNYLDELQEMVESVHSNRGTLLYTPPRNALPVTFNIESARLSGLPQEGWYLNKLYCEPELTFECQPFGVLAPVIVVGGTSVGGPIGSIEIPNVPGHVEAWGEVTFAEGSAAIRRHIEVAVQEDYDPASPEPLLHNLSSGGLTTSGFAGASGTRSGSYSTNVIRATLSGSPLAICGITPQPHKGLWRPRLRVWPSASNQRVRLAWKVGDGPLRREAWADVPDSSNFFELDLGILNIQELTPIHAWQGQIEAYQVAGSQPLDIDVLFTVPG